MALLQTEDQIGHFCDPQKNPKKDHVHIVKRRLKSLNKSKKPHDFLSGTVLEFDPLISPPPHPLEILTLIFAPFLFPLFPPPKYTGWVRSFIVISLICR